ncbi:MAG: thioredoxin-disulfide reductase [Planctomycetota bacterium]|nr:thioredoxin-disulfide reductase [Planctomycetota bacterium]MEC8734808.1 thioredoxin-disulfide reductase [Planctomycetota bacterium]MEC8819228.1 thioredoxin-disulfide reductase [Planctomycetota bacterium]MEC9158107.1 thioredoxin-disulfide reductase [Planctomycetota bacterium]MED5507717.1 thioredoxin-disulfide reductase [Planctomycetota bacterium]
MSAESIENVVIIGSGPAGWTAAIYCARADLSPLCLIGVPKQNPAPVLPGGQLMLTTDVENYPGFPEGVTGPEMMDLFQKQAERFGTRVVGKDVVGCGFSERPFTLELSDGSTVRTRSVIIATGATANWLGLDNELRLATSGGGVSACAVCDGALPMFRDQPLAVVGGGDTAMEEASYLAKFASTVHVIHRRDEFRASKTMAQRVLDAPNIEVHWNKQVADVLGESTIEAVELEDTVTGERSRLPVTGLFIAIGHSPATDFLRDSGVALDDSGYVVLESRGSTTNLEGIFAAGDVADAEYRQAITAAGMGCAAAIDCERWLAEQGVH